MNMKKYTFEREDLSSRLSDACIVGHTTRSTAKIWVRVAVAGTYTCVVSKQRMKFDAADIGQQVIDVYLEDKGIQTHSLLERQIESKDDKTCVFELSNLEANTVYHYAVVANPGVGIDRRWRFGFAEAHHFKTLSEQTKTLTFGYFSCHDPFKRGTSGMGLWDDFYAMLDEHDANFVIGGGDQMYIDCTKEDIWKWVSKHKDQLWDDFRHDEQGLIDYFKTIYRYVYRKYWSFPELKKVFRSFPMYMIWDDHEIMDGWGSYTDDELSDKLDTLFEWENKTQNLFIAYAMFKAAKAVYIEYQHCHNPDTPDNQFDYPLSKGDVGLYTLDMRGHRKYTGLNDGKSVLGDEQFGRFESWISSAEMKAKKALFIVSPVPVVHWNSTFVNALDIASARDDFRDEWDHESNYKERDKILDLVFQYSRQSGKPVVFLSGDVHCAAAFQLTRRGGDAVAKVFQFTSSGITRAPAPKISTAMMLKSGKLGHEKGDKITCFKRLLFVTRHNFGLIRCKAKDGTFEVWGNLYSSENEENELIQSRVKLL